MESTTPIRKRYERLLVLCFLVCVVAPLVTCNFGPVLYAMQAPYREWWRPGMDWFERLHVGFNHEFGGRQELVRMQAHMKLQILSTSPSDQVIVGQDGWLFLGHYEQGDSVYDGLRDFLHVHPFSPEEETGWVQYFEAKRQALAQRGIQYVLLFAPNKPTVYPEYMPKGMRPMPAPSRLDRMLQLLRQTTIDVVEVTPDLVARKGKERVYYKTDTHWNIAGGLVAYQTLIHHLHYQDLPVVRLANESPTTNLPVMGDMVDLYHEDDLNPVYKVEAGPTTESITWSRAHPPDPMHPKPSAYIPLAMVTIDRSGSQMQRALLIGDSFLGFGLGTMLAQHFDHSERVFSHRLDLQQVDRLKPQIVIEEFVEEQLEEQLRDPFLP